MDDEWWSYKVPLKTYEVTLSTKEVMLGHDAVFSCTMSGVTGTADIKWSHIKADGRLNLKNLVFRNPDDTF